MIIHRVELHHVKGIDHLVLDNLDDTGVTVIHGPNEEGKSTILEAIGMVLSSKFNSKAQAVKALAQQGSTEGARIVLEATLGDERITLDKTFNTRASAVLRTASGTTTNHDAEEQLKQLLEQHIDPQLQELAFMCQGQLDTAVQALGLPSLRRSLEHNQAGHDSDDTCAMHSADATELAAGDDTLISLALDEASRYYTLSKRNPTKELKEALTQHNQAQLTLNDIEDAYAQHQSHVDEVERAHARRAAAEQNLGELATKLDTAIKTHEAAKATVEKYDKIAAERQAILNKVRSHEDLLEHHQHLVDEHLRTTQALTEAQAELAELSTTVTAHNAALDAARQQRELADEEHLEARRKLDTAAKLEEFISNCRAAWEATRQSQRAHAAAATLDELNAAKNALLVGDEEVRHAEELDVEVRTHRMVLQANSASMQVESDTPTTVDIDDETITVGAEGTEWRPITADTTVTVGLVRVHLTPGQGEATTQHDLTQAELQLSEFLQRFHVDSLSQLKDEAAHAAEVRREYREAEEALARIVGAGSVETLGRQAQQLRDSVEATAEELGEKDFLAELFQDHPHATGIAAGAGAGSDTEDEVEAIAQDQADAEAIIATLDTRAEAAAEKIHAAQQRLNQAEAAAAQARVTWEELVESPVREKFATASARIESAEDSAQRAHRAREAFEEKHPPETLKDAERELRAQLAEIKQAFDAAKIAMEAADPALAAELVAGAQAAVAAAQETIDKAEGDIRLRNAQIASAQGIAEQYNVAHARLREAERRAHAVQRRADAAWTLWETLVRYRDEARATYAQPYTQLLDQLLTQVFRTPTTTTLDNNLDIAGRAQNGEAVDLNQLSGGAQEQIAVLQRLAVSQLVQPEDRLPLIIDDALGNTDSERLQTMNAVISRMGQKSQVIILTCAPERFAFMPGARRVSMSELKTLGQQAARGELL